MSRQTAVQGDRVTCKRGGAAMPATLAEHAECWQRDRGRRVPPRGTESWRVMYEEWVADRTPEQRAYVAIVYVMAAMGIRFKPVN